MTALVQTAAGDPVTGGLLQFGAVGILAVLALVAVRVLYNRVSEAERLERARADRLEEELRALNALIRDQYVQTITKATDAISDVLDHIDGAPRRGR